MKFFKLFLFLSIHSICFSQQWETVVSLPGNSPIKQIEVVNDNNIYVSSQYYKLHHWDGSQWSSVGNFNPGFNGIFKYINDDLIYATHNDYGTFNTNLSNYNYIAKWDGNSWSNFGNFNQPKPIYNFKIISETEIYAVGAFDDLENYRWRSVAKYNGTTWSVVGLGDSKAGTYSGNNSLWVNNTNDIYSKHDGYRSNGAQRVKHWDGNSWTVLFSSEDEIDGVDRIHVVSENEIYINSWNKNFDYGVIGMWDGNYWKILGDLQTDINTGDFYGSVDFLFINSTEIYAFGSALRNKSNFTYQVAVWNGLKWSNLENLNANNPVTAAFYKEGFLYVGGSFTESGKTVIKKIDAQKVLSVKNTSSSSKKLAFPNPVSDVLYLNKEYVSVQIFSVLGTNVSNHKNTNKIDCKTLPKGIYLLKAEDKNGVIYSKKIIKK